MSASERKKEPYVDFEFGMIAGLIVGMVFSFLSTKILNNQMNYWKISYCLADENPPDFCVQEPQYVEFKKTLANLDAFTSVEGPHE